MEPVDRYLEEVAFWLPRERRDDVVAELGDDIRSRVEEQEAGLGRKLERAEVEALLEAVGAPTRVAARYHPERYLIGPALFPLYSFVTRLVAVGAIVPRLLVWLALVALLPAFREAHAGWGVVSVLWSCALTAVYVIAAVTVAFALIERHQVRLEARGPGGLPAEGDPNRISRGASIFGLVWNLVLMEWWLELPQWSQVRAGAPEVRVWEDFRMLFYWPVALLLAAGIAVAGRNLLRPCWTRCRLAFGALLHGMAALFVSLAVALHWEDVQEQWATVTMAAPGLTDAEMVGAWAGIAVSAALAVLALGCGVSFIRRAIRAVRWKPAPTSG